MPRGRRQRLLKTLAQCLAVEMAVGASRKPAALGAGAQANRRGR
jgi:hypothetical protein